MIEQNNLKFLGLFFLLFPLTQVGYTYYISIQLLLVFILLFNFFYVKELKVVFISLLILIPIMVFPAMIVSQGEIFHTILLTSRQCFILAVFLSIGIISRPYYGLKKEYIKYLLLFLFSVVFLQWFFLKTSGVSLMVPSELLISNQGTLKALEFAVDLGITYHIRPSALFGEPSYLAFVCVSLVYIILVNKAFSEYEKKLYAAIAILIVLLAQSMSGVIALFVLFSAVFLRNINMKYMLVMVMCTIFLLCITIWLQDTVIVKRLLSIMSFDGSDASSMTRFVAPMTLISSVFQDYPFGGTSRDLLEALYGVEGVVHGVDNALLNLFINYGYFGFVLWAIIIAVFYRNPMALLYIVLVTMFNGAFLTIDKLGVIGMTLILARSTENVARDNKVLKLKEAPYDFNTS